MGLVVVCAFISIFHIERDGATKEVEMGLCSSGLDEILR